MNKHNKSRSSFSGKIGYVLAAAGASVGLGNIWRFPYLAAKYGGGIFLLIYILLALTFGYSMIVAESAIGRMTRKSPVGAFQSFGKSKWLSAGGWINAIIPILIVPYYSVIGGWVIKYLIEYVKGNSTLLAEDGYFSGFISNGVSTELCFAVFCLITVAIIYAGVRNGIERVSKVMMPILIVLSVIIAVYSVTRPGALAGVKYFLVPNLKNFSWMSVVAAMGQMFYSLSIAMGILVTFGSYMKKDVSIEESTEHVEIFDTLIAVMAGMAVMPACSAFGVEYGAGPGLLFASMQTVFSHMGSVGNLIGFLFYLLVLIAALTSSISMLELCTAYAVDKQIEKGLTPKRAKHTSEVAALVFIAGSLVALDGLGAGVAGGAAVETPATLLGLSVRGWNDCWLDLYDMVAEGILMPLGALVMTILIGWVLKPEVVQLECEQSGVKYRAAGYFKVCFKFIVPVLLAFILFCQLTDFFGLNIPGLS